MKIIQLCYILSSGGAEKFIVDLSNELAARGHDVTVCMIRDADEPALSFNKQFLSPDVKFHTMHFQRGFTLGKSNAVQRYIRQQKPDVVHCHLNVIPYIFRMALTNKKIKFFHTLHSVAENTAGDGYQYPFNKFFYGHNLVRPVCISRLCQESYERFYKLTNAPYIDNGRAFVKPTERIGEVRAEVEGYKASAATPVFIHVARYHEQKNQQLLIDAFNKLDAQGEDFTLMVIGNGYDSEGGRALRAAACDKIHFLGEKNNVNDYLTCSDAFCLTSLYEGLPISLLEALSCGVTPICTPVGGIPDVVKSGISGYLSAGMSVDEYLAAVRTFMAQPIEGSDLVRYFEANYSMATCAEKYEKLYLS